MAYFKWSSNILCVWDSTVDIATYCGRGNWISLGWDFPCLPRLAMRFTQTPAHWVSWLPQGYSCRSWWDHPPPSHAGLWMSCSYASAFVGMSWGDLHLDHYITFWYGSWLVAQIRGIYATLEFMLWEKQYSDIILPDYSYALVVYETAFHLLYLMFYLTLF